jgi:hypothetical protein
MREKDNHDVSLLLPNSVNLDLCSIKVSAKEERAEAQALLDHLGL